MVFDFACQFSMLGWIDRTQAACEDGDGSTAGSQCPPMGRAVDATCQAADDRVASMCQAGSQAFGDTPAICGTMPRADDTNGPLVFFC
ncbi:MAG: hypothetical protein KatS3mg105_0865 [Gemmatales bacterium]|nr:MAG: hypothetical protein KatS3mg105_0865 [Gemmatales bacterium]